MNERLRVLIVDDEAPARRRLRRLLASMPGVEVVGEAADGLGTLARVQAGGVDVVLLDIAMPDMDGIEAARCLARLDPAPAVVFCTAYDAYALAAFEAAALDYLLKPIRAERLAAALQRVRRLDPQQQAQLALGQRQRRNLVARLAGSLRLIPIDQVHYLQAEEKYVIAHHAQGEDVIDEPLRALETEFAERFVRIHRNCLVAREAVARIERDAGGHCRVWLRSGAGPLEVSRRLAASLPEKLGLNT